CGEAGIRFQPAPGVIGNATDYWAPTNWASLDSGDLDIGASGPVLVDVPGATPAHLVVVAGKDQHAYLCNRDNLGGVHAPVASASETINYIFGGPATYRTNQGTYVALRDGSNALRTFRITATSPPTIASGWSVSRNGC